MKVYIVDKMFENLKSYESIFRKNHSNWNIKYFTHCSDLENSINSESPDLVVIDADNEYGIITAKKVKSMNDNIKIIISSIDNMYLYYTLDNNYDDFLPKPINEEKIKEIIKKFNIK